MHWLTQLLKARASGSVLHSVQFDTKGWILAKRRRNSLEWRNADGDTLRACVDSTLPATLSGLSDRDSLRAFYREEAIRHGGGIVCAEIVQAGGIRSVKVICKQGRKSLRSCLVSGLRSCYFSCGFAGRRPYRTGVAVEKGTKAVISVNFRLYGRRTFNNLRTNFAVEIP